MNQNVTYKDAGVDIEKGDALVEKIKLKVKNTYGKRVRQGVGGFACLFDMEDGRLLSAGTDGVGTKLMIAQKLGIHDTVGIDLVAMCVNDVLCTGARPLFFMDYLATGKLDVEVSSQIIDGVVEGCRQSEAALIGGETAEMPGMYTGGEYDLAGFTVGEVREEHLLDGSYIKEGQTLIGLPSSGFHSNGFSLLRKLVTDDEKDLLKSLLTPTRIYWNDIKDLLREKKISGLSHITGGGFLNISRMNDGLDYTVNNFSFADNMPSFMNEVIKRSQLGDRELYRTFNMGIGLVMATDCPEEVMVYFSEKGKTAYELGMIRRGGGNVILERGEKIIL